MPKQKRVLIYTVCALYKLRRSKIKINSPWIVLIRECAKSKFYEGIFILRFDLFGLLEADKKTFDDKDWLPIDTASKPV